MFVSILASRRKLERVAMPAGETKHRVVSVRIQIVACWDSLVPGSSSLGDVWKRFVLRSLEAIGCFFFAGVE